MAHCLNLPYKRNNPRSVRGARRRGWIVVFITEQAAKQLSKNMLWMSLNLWCEKYCEGYWISSHYLVEFAFEKSADATLFQLKWA